MATAADWEVTPEKVAAAVRRLAEGAHPVRIVIFGSAARGELHEDSDLDLIVVMPGKVENWRQESVRLRDMVGDIHMAMDILVISDAEAEWKIKHPRSVIGEALREGVIAYQRQT